MGGCFERKIWDFNWLSRRVQKRSADTRWYVSTTLGCKHIKTHGWCSISLHLGLAYPEKLLLWKSANHSFCSCSLQETFRQPNKTFRRSIKRMFLESTYNSLLFTNVWQNNHAEVPRTSDFHMALAIFRAIFCLFLVFSPVFRCETVFGRSQSWGNIFRQNLFCWMCFTLIYLISHISAIFGCFSGHFAAKTDFSSSWWHVAQTSSILKY